MTVFGIKGLPTKRRVRFGGGGHTDQRTKDEMAVIRETYEAASGYRPPMDGKVHVRIDVFGKLPKREKRPKPMLKTPDADNIAKVFMDALNGVAYADDRQVTLLVVQKHDMRPTTPYDYCICTVTADETDESDYDDLRVFVEVM